MITKKLCQHRHLCEERPQWDEYIPVCPDCPRFCDSSHTSNEEVNRKVDNKTEEQMTNES